MPVAAWVAARLPRLAGRALEVALAVAALLGAHGGYEVRGGREIVLAAIGLALLAAAAWRSGACASGERCSPSPRLAPRRRRSPPATAARTASTTGAIAASTRALDALLAVAPAGQRIGLAGDWSVGGLSPAWPAFGTRIDNEVEYVGDFVAAS